MPASAPVGSEPFSTVNGAPLWKREERADLPAAEQLARDALLIAHSNGSSHTKLPDEAMRPVVQTRRALSASMSNESCATATSPLDGLKISDAVSRGWFQV